MPIFSSIQNVDHTNILTLLEGLMRLEHDTRQVLTASGCRRDEAPPIHVDGQILSIIGRLADLY